MADEIDPAKTIREALEAARKRAEHSESDLAASHQWYAERWKVMDEWFRSDEMRRTLPAKKWFSIQANGTQSVSDPPTYAQLLNLAKHRAKTAEAERDSLRAELEQERKADIEVQRIVGALESDLAASQEREREVGEQLEFDRTALADAITGIKKAFDSRFWLTEGRGSYEWDDDRYRSEFREAYQEINRAIEPLKKIAADWAGCPRKAEDVAKARIDLKRRAESAEERERGLREALTKLSTEVKGLLGLAPIAIRDAVGNANVACVLSRLEESAAALATPEGQGR